jgi:hypothetical protein
MQGDIDINKQFFTTANSKFVLHDGGGFESDDSNNVSTVKDFIARRLEMPDLEDKLHAIWYEFWLSLVARWKPIVQGFASRYLISRDACLRMVYETF